jgi:hypothetical protein
VPVGSTPRPRNRGLRSRDEARHTGKYVKSDAVIGRLAKMLARAKTSAKARR